MFVCAHVRLFVCLFIPISTFERHAITLQSNAVYFNFLQSTITTWWSRELVGSVVEFMNSTRKIAKKVLG